MFGHVPGASMSEFTDYLQEVFADLGAIRARRMFGGYGIYCNDRMFGLVADDVLYLKTDAQSVDAFVARGLEPFVYIKDGKPMTMSYFTAPEEIFDDPVEAKRWGRMACDAALRSGKPRHKR